MIIDNDGIWQRLVDIYGFVVEDDFKEDLELVYAF